MKTGELASIMGVSHVTIRAWVDNELLQKYFSASARGVDGFTQRTYTESDVLVCNTIRQLRADNSHVTWEQIATHLETGNRETDFPLNAIGSDMRTISIQQAEQSAKAAATLAELNAANQVIDELRNRITTLETEKESIRKELTGQVLELTKRVGFLEGQLSAMNKDDSN